MTEGQKLTFFEKKQSVCPVCEAKFFREDLLSGGGRLIAGNLTRELRRQYDPSKKYGEVRPLLYPVTVCPVCYFAAFPQDFINQLCVGRCRMMRKNLTNRLHAELSGKLIET